MKKVYFLVLLLVFSTQIFCAEQQEKTLEDVKALCGQVMQAIVPLALVMEKIKVADQETTATKLAALTLQTALETATRNFQNLEKKAAQIAFPFTRP